MSNHEKCDEYFQKAFYACQDAQLIANKVIKERDDLKKLADELVKALKLISICDCEANENPELIHYCDGKKARVAEDALAQFNRGGEN